jgi:hypothetical protein
MRGIKRSLEEAGGYIFFWVRSGSDRFGSIGFGLIECPIDQFNCFGLGKLTEVVVRGGCAERKHQEYRSGEAPFLNSALKVKEEVIHAFFSPVA